MELKNLFKPITINGMELKNRVIMPALHHLYTPDGYANARFNEYYWRRAEGGASLIFVGGCRTANYGGAGLMMSLESDDYIPGWKEFTDGMHARGAKVGVQLYQAGAYAHRSANGGKPAYAPSVIISKFTHEETVEATKEDIKMIIADEAAAAVRAKKAGFDIVELLGSAGYLVDQFLSPVKNKRTDEYGGSWENRIRFAKELVAAVREAVGPYYPLCMRIFGNDLVPGSSTNVESVMFAKEMEACGIDVFNVTGGWHESKVPQLTGDLPRAGFAYLAGNVKDAVKIPVIVSNRINNPELAEKVLTLGYGDMVSIGRPQVADPDWVKKSQAGESHLIRRCMACNQGCLAKTFFEKPIECLVNGTCGREYLFKEKGKDIVKKNVLIIGGGPAGCELAIKASELGHYVTLWEKEARLGGQLPMVAAPVGKEEYHELIKYYENMTAHLGVNVVLNKTATVDEIKEADFDVVVTATGMTPKTIPLPNDGSVEVTTAYEVLKGNVYPGKNVVVIGGGSVGCETALTLAHDASLSPEQVYFIVTQRSETSEFLMSQVDKCRRNIAIVDMVKIGAGFDPGCGWPVMKDLGRLGVKQYPFSTITDIKNGVVSIHVVNKKTGEESDVDLPADTVILSVGARSNNALYEELKAAGINAINLGDSDKIGKIIDAVEHADDLAYEL